MNQYNEKGQAHGYWEEYYDNGNLWYKGTYINRVEVGDWEIYNVYGELTYKTYYIR